MLDSIHHMTLNVLKNHIFGVKTSIFCHLLPFVSQQYNKLVVYRFYCVISLPDATSCDK